MFNVCEQQFFNPSVLYEKPAKGIDMILLGLVGDSSHAADQFLSKQVTCHLFAQNPPNGLGSDLFTLNVQRGRDHGIPGQICYHNTIKLYGHEHRVSKQVNIDVQCESKK